MIKFLTALRCPLCLRRKKKLFAVEGELFAKREDFLETREFFLDEREMLLNKREAQFEGERESMAGRDGAEIKRSILLSSLQKKWQADKKKIDAERMNVLESLPKVKISFEQRKLDLTNITNNIKKKPSTVPNHDLLLNYEGRLMELNEILMLMDQERTNEPTDKENINS